MILLWVWFYQPPLAKDIVKVTYEFEVKFV